MSMDNNFEENGSPAFGEEELSEQQNMNSTAYPPKEQQDAGNAEPQNSDFPQPDSPQTVSWQQISSSPYPQTNEQGQPYRYADNGQPYGMNAPNNMPGGQP